MVDRTCMLTRWNVPVLKALQVKDFFRVFWGEDDMSHCEEKRWDIPIHTPSHYKNHQRMMHECKFEGDSTTYDSDWWNWKIASSALSQHQPKIFTLFFADTGDVPATRIDFCKRNVTLMVIDLSENLSVWVGCHRASQNGKSAKI